MSSIRVQKQLEGAAAAIQRLGNYPLKKSQDAIIWSGPIASGPYAGSNAIVLDFTAATWADNNLRAIIVSLPASDYANSMTMKTQSHASGQFMDGSASFKVYFESPEGASVKAALVTAQAAFQLNVLQHLRGQLGAPMEVFYGDNDVQPQVEGVNGANAGAEAACNFLASGFLQPYGGFSYPGGV